MLLPGTKSPVHRHTDTSEVVVCIYGSAIERFYDDEGNETEMVVMTAGSDCPGVVVEQGRYHSLEARMRWVSSLRLRLISIIHLKLKIYWIRVV